MHIEHPSFSLALTNKVGGIYFGSKTILRLQPAPGGRNRMAHGSGNDLDVDITSTSHFPQRFSTKIFRRPGVASGSKQEMTLFVSTLFNSKYHPRRFDLKLKEPVITAF